MGAVIALLSFTAEFAVMLPIILLQTHFYRKTLGMARAWRGKRLVLAVLLATAANAALQAIAVNLPGFTWVSLFNLAVFLAYPFVFMGGARMEQLLFSVLNLAVFMFSVLLTGIVLYPRGLVHTTLPMMLLVLVLLLGVYAGLVLVLCHISTGGKRRLPRKYWVGMVVCFAAIALLLMVVSGLYRGPNAAGLYPYLTLFSLAALLVWLLLYTVFCFICRYFAKAGEAEALALLNDMTERYLQQKQTANERIQILSHDLKHSLTGWRALAEEKGDAAALQSIAEYEGQLQAAQLLQVGNEGANALLNQKYWEAGAAGVDFVADGLFYPDLIVSRLDLCSLLGNLLDNALEAAAGAPAQQLRCVKLTIRRKGRLLLLVVENGYGAEPVEQDGGFATRKEDKQLHALGMRSIRYIAEGYGGVVQNSYGGGWFRASVMLQGYAGEHSDEN